MSRHVVHAIRVAARTADDYVVFHMRVGGVLLHRLERVSLELWRKYMGRATVVP